MQEEVRRLETALQASLEIRARQGRGDHVAIRRKPAQYRLATFPSDRPAAALQAQDRVEDTRGRHARMSAGNSDRLPRCGANLNSVENDSLILKTRQQHSSCTAS